MNHVLFWHYQEKLIDICLHRESSYEEEDGEDNQAVTEALQGLVRSHDLNQLLFMANELT